MTGGQRNAENRLVAASFLAALFFIAASALIYALFAEKFISSVYHGESSFDVLNRLVEAHRAKKPDIRQLSYYLTAGTIILARLLMIVGTIPFAILAWTRRRWVLSVLREYFRFSAHPMNLAFFRIILFGFLFAWVDTDRILWFSALPTALQIPPTGSEWFLRWFPVNPSLAAGAALFFRIACLAAMAGIWTRGAMWLAVLSGYYVLGVTQFYGKVAHYHHLLWFAAVTASSPAGDFLSVDAAVAGWKKSERARLAPPAAHRRYGLPLCFIWLLIGVVYFFPGVWKLWKTGFHWFLSDNLKFILHASWLELEPWVPAFRIDRYPILYRPAALGSVVFEVSFIFLILFGAIRPWAAWAGLLFHNATYQMMRILFLELQICYAAFVDWAKWMGRLGRLLYREPAHCVYDGDRAAWRKTTALCRVLDVFGRVIYKDVRMEIGSDDRASDAARTVRAERGMRVVLGKKTYSGAAAFRALAFRVPLLLPLLPFAWAWSPARASGSGGAAGEPKAAEPPAPPGEKAGLRATAWVGTALLVINIGFGVVHLKLGWPFACYPTFAGVYKPFTDVLTIASVGSDGTETEVDQKRLKDKFGTAHLSKLVDQTLEEDDPSRRNRRLAALWKVVSDLEPRYASAGRVLFYRDTVGTDPDNRKGNLIRRELLLDWDIPSPL